MEFWKLYNYLQNRVLASGLETNQLAQRHTESQWAIRLGPAVLLRSGALHLVSRVKSLRVLVHTLSWVSDHITTKAPPGIPGFHRKLDTAPCQVAFQTWCASYPFRVPWISWFKLRFPMVSLLASVARLSSGVRRRSLGGGAPCFCLCGQCRHRGI